MNNLTHGIRSIIRKMGYDIVPFKTHNGKPTPSRDWESNSHFLRIYNECKGWTLLDRQRQFSLWQILLSIQDREGSYAEIGVYRGGTAKLIALMKPEKSDLHLFDTFGGMPKTKAGVDEHQEGDFSDTSEESVKRLVSGFKNIHLHKGFFPETASPVINEKFLFVHIDVDIYQSIYDCCKFFYPRMLSGGIMLFDDYAFPSCPGVLQAIRDFYGKDSHPEIQFITGQCMIIKC